MAQNEKIKSTIGCSIITLCAIIVYWFLIGKDIGRSYALMVIGLIIFIYLTAVLVTWLHNKGPFFKTFHKESRSQKQKFSLNIYLTAIYVTFASIIGILFFMSLVLHISIIESIVGSLVIFGLPLFFVIISIVMLYRFFTKKEPIIFSLLNVFAPAKEIREPLLDLELSKPKQWINVISTLFLCLAMIFWLIMAFNTLLSGDLF